MIDNRKRILYIERPTNFGGSTTGLYDLITGLDKSCFEPVVLFYGPHSWEDKFQDAGAQIELLSDQSVPAKTLSADRDIRASLSRFNRTLGDTYWTLKQFYQLYHKEQRTVHRLTRKLQSLNIDIVHHNNNLPGNRASILAAKRVGLPQIAHVRMLTPFTAVERRLARDVDAFIYMSTAIREVYESAGIPASQGRVIYDAFDERPFQYLNGAPALREQFGLADSDFVISNIGRICHWKGQDDVIRAMSQVVQQQPNIKALIVGSASDSHADQQFDKKLHDLVDKHDLQNSVVFAGFRSDIPQIMAMSDVVVHSSSEPEPFGRVVVEAMLSGTPVVATKAGGPLDIIDDGQTGLLVPPKSPENMARAILKLAEQPTQSAAMSHLANQTARERFSMRQHVKQVQALYQQILEQVPS